MDVKRFAIIRTSFVAEHNYPQAPLPVQFLREKHRHTFEVIVEVEQYHNDRDLEYWILKDAVDHEIGWILQGGTDIGSTSCEALAERLHKQLKGRCGASRYVKVTVTEDGYNGGRIEG